MGCDIAKLSKCAWCGKDKNELVIAKRQNKAWCDAPMSIITNYEPCEKCQEKWDQGTVLIEASETPNTENQPLMSEGAYPTGNYWVVNPDILNIDSPIAFITKEIATDLGLYNTEESKNGRT